MTQYEVYKIEAGKEKPLVVYNNKKDAEEMRDRLNFKKNIYFVKLIKLN